jgi:hypothetical protein
MTDPAWTPTPDEMPSDYDDHGAEECDRYAEPEPPKPCCYRGCDSNDGLTLEVDLCMEHMNVALGIAPAALVAERDRLRAALDELFGFVESGALVRSTADDGEPGWPLRASKLVMALKRAAQALGRIPT